jgi:hypothetical protein
VTKFLSSFFFVQPCPPVFVYESVCQLEGITSGEENRKKYRVPDIKISDKKEGVGGL